MMILMVALVHGLEMIVLALMNEPVHQADVLQTIQIALLLMVMSLAVHDNQGVL